MKIHLLCVTKKFFVFEGDGSIRSPLDSCCVLNCYPHPHEIKGSKHRQLRRFFHSKPSTWFSFYFKSRKCFSESKMEISKENCAFSRVLRRIFCLKLTRPHTHTQKYRIIGFDQTSCCGEMFWMKLFIIGRVASFDDLCSSRCRSLLSKQLHRIIVSIVLPGSKACKWLFNWVKLRRVAMYSSWSDCVIANCFLIQFTFSLSRRVFW